MMTNDYLPCLKTTKEKDPLKDKCAILEANCDEISFFRKNLHFFEREF